MKMESVPMKSAEAKPSVHFYVCVCVYVCVSRWKKRLTLDDDDYDDVDEDDRQHHHIAKQSTAIITTTYIAYNSRASLQLPSF